MDTPAPRPPLPGHHLVPRPDVDADAMAARVNELLVAVDAAASAPTGEDTEDPHGLVSLTRQARALEEAHDVLVEALASVDKS